MERNRDRDINVDANKDVEIDRSLEQHAHKSLQAA